MAEKLDKLRLMAQRLKDKVHLPQVSAGSREKVDQILTRYNPAVKVNEIAEKFKTDTLSKRVQELVSKYEKFTGVEEIMALQNTVVEAQVTFNLFLLFLVGWCIRHISSSHFFAWFYTYIYARVLTSLDSHWGRDKSMTREST